MFYPEDGVVTSKRRVIFNFFFVFVLLWNTNWEIRKSFKNIWQLISLPELSFSKFDFGITTQRVFGWGWKLYARGKGRQRIGGGNSFSFLPSNWKKKEKRNEGNTGYFIAYGILYGLPLWNSTYFFTVQWVSSEKEVEKHFIDHKASKNLHS
jgi:hypothetical protein